MPILVYSNPPFEVIATGFALQLSVIDLQEMRIPNRILLPGIGLTAFSILLIGLMTSELIRALFALAGGAISVLIFFFLHLLRPSGLGMGDVKFAGLIGLTLSWISFPVGLIGLALAFIASSIFSIIIFVVKRNNFQRVIPFAPFMFLGLLFVEFGLIL